MRPIRYDTRHYRYGRSVLDLILDSLADRIVRRLIDGLTGRAIH